MGTLQTNKNEAGKAKPKFERMRKSKSETKPGDLVMCSDCNIFIKRSAMAQHKRNCSPSDVKNQRPCKRCRVCYARGIRTKAGRDVKTVYICKDCPSEPGLHPGLCFEVYHTKIDYVTVE